MIDYIASKSAQREYEERIGSLTPVSDYDKWLTGEAGHWQAPSLGTVVESLVKSVAFLANRRNHQPEATPSTPVTVPEGRRVTG